jgi:outer membrane protein assembly factor BamE
MIETMQLIIPGPRPPLGGALRTLGALFVLSGLLGGAGCVYRMPVQQGNHLDATTIAQVKAGMTRGQVRYLLGTPMVPGGFLNDRWDYEYYLKMRRLQTPRRAHATVYFRNELVDHVVSDVAGDVSEPVSKRPVTAPGA